MALFGSILKQGLKLSKAAELEKPPAEYQQLKELKKLLNTAKDTQFGQKFDFREVLRSGKRDKRELYRKFVENVPVYNYNKIFEEWWHKSKNGESDVCWPGKIKYFALSSGTSEAASKHIPLTSQMIDSNKKTGLRQVKTLSQYDLPDKMFTKGILMLGGSTELNRSGHYFEGDLSGIQASKIPFWFHKFYKPGREIARNKDWNKKLKQITEEAKDWDIGYVVGVPAWIQLMMEGIIEHYKLNNIHEIWPNLMVFAHGGVSFEPYKKSFEKLLGKPLIYIETYLASEGFIAFQNRPGTSSMAMALDTGLFFEFVPFNEKNFDENGEIAEHPQTLMIDEVEEGKDYALLLSTCAGTWRYLIGDVIRFTDKSKSEIIITGRTKHFLSLCGEHLSVDNMNKGIKEVANSLGICINEYTVAGIPYESLFAHKWFVGVEGEADAARVKEVLDLKLKELNDDYKTERISALKEIFVHVIPVSLFYKWMKSKGKEGGQNKFPRVMKKAQLEDWESFLLKEGYNVK
jgi:hypothetical protein